MIAWSMRFTLTLGMCIIAPRLPMSTLRLCILSTTIAGTMTSIAFGSAPFVGFPVPFALEFQAAPFAMLLASALWFSWKDVLRKDTPTRQSLKRYVFVLIAQVVMLQTYIGFNLVFNQLQGHNQTFLCILLPLIKLVLKNCVGWATFHLEDLSPTIVIFTVDVYHALFVSLTMQQASTIGANIVVVVLDMVQNCIAYTEISKVLTLIDTLADEDKSTSNSTERSRYSASDIRLRVSVVDYAGYLLKSVRSVRQSPEISLPRHLRVASDRSRRRSSVEDLTESRRMSSTRISPILEHSSFGKSSLPPTEEKRISRIFSRSLSKHSTRHVACTRAVLKLLHMTEFYVLVEFIEVMLTDFYAVYMTILSYLPNRVFYTQLSHLSASQLRLTASSVGVTRTCRGSATIGCSRTCG